MYGDGARKEMRYRKGELADDPNAAQVPTLDEAKRQAWQRKAAQARKVIEEYEAWKQEAQKTHKVKKTRNVKQEKTHDQK